ncbi:MAG: hypothetical protein GY780_15195 [bacterium]|nr:hypothetical protein [bacterium]
MLDLHCKGLFDELCPHLKPLLESAAGSLDLATDFFSISVIADDFPEAEKPWLQLSRSSLDTEKRLEAKLFCSEASFCTLQPLTRSILPASQVWEQAPAPRNTSLFDEASFSSERASAFLHHEWLLARDWARSEIVPSAIPEGQIEAFSESWAVVIDGRLSRLGLPGYSMVERRSQFSGLFSGAGVLLPDHWQIFQSLWDGGITDWHDVLAVLRHLPRL